MGVLLSRLAVGVTHPLLDHPDRHSRRGHRGAERVAQLVERDHTLKIEWSTPRWLRMVFFASPDHLGEYVLVDYVRNKRKWIQ